MLHSLTTRNENVFDLSARDYPGRKQLVKRLFERYAQDLRRFLLGQSVATEEVDDVVQELFERLMSLKQLEVKMSDATGSSRSYLLAMANSLMVDRRRNQQMREAYAAAQQEIEGERMEERSPERIVAAQLEAEAIRAIILDMPLNWRVALILQRLRNMSYKEIALHMGVTARQVERYLLRAFRRLRKERRKIETAGERKC